MGWKMSKDKLYKLSVEEKYLSETGKEIISNEIVVGYYVGEEEEWFYGSSYLFENGRWFGGDTITFSKTDFETSVKKVEEIA